VLAQSYRNLELIVVDDGSWDSTKEVVKRFGDRRIRYRYIPHSGTPRALNAGLDLARGELIGYLASDDEWETDFLKFMVKGIITNPEVGLVYCGYRVYEPNNSHPKIVRPRFDFIKALYRFYITMCGILHRRECIEEIGGFDERLLRGQDWDFLIRLFDAYKTGFVDRILCTIYQREEYKGPVSECGVILEEKIQDFLRKRLTYSV
jgi:glycosyltransferase involved in cell wall biosynthesis